MRMLVCAVATMLAVTACTTPNAELGAQGNVLFNAIGTYSGTSGLTIDGLMVGAPMFIELSSPEVGQSSLLADLDLTSSPPAAADVVRFLGGRFLLIAKKSGNFDIEARRNGQIFDTLVGFRGVVGKDLQLSTPTITTTESTVDGVTFTFKPYQGDMTKPIELGTNQRLSVIAVPQDANKLPLMGIVDLVIDTDYQRLAIDISFPASPGLVANQVTMSPVDKSTSNVDVAISDPLTGGLQHLTVALTGKIAVP
jgi:hypothetical protein